jgi:hypothetical protein
MAKPDTIIIEGRAFSWQQLCAARREQVEAWKEAHGRQLVLFELEKDSRPQSERTASSRYAEPTMLDLMRGSLWDGNDPT